MYKCKRFSWNRGGISKISKKHKRYLKVLSIKGNIVIDRTYTHTFFILRLLNPAGLLLAFQFEIRDPRFDNIKIRRHATTMATATPGATSTDLQYYTCDNAALDALRKSCPWKDDPRYFKKVSLSPSSVMKMVGFIGCGILHE
jgi:hypothetical protein